MMGKVNSKKKGLGRGLDGLLKIEKTPDKIELKSPKGTDIQMNDEKIIHTVAIENLKPNKEQPRKVFDSSALNELAESIKEQGIMQPIVAMKTGEGSYEIIAGERRWRAAQRSGLTEVPVILKKVDSQKKLELAIIENIQRDDLNPIEEAEAYNLLAEKYGMTQKDIAQKVGKDRATVANLMRVTSLSEDVKAMVSKGEISLGHAKVLLPVEDKKQQKEFALKVLRLNMSVRALETMIKSARSSKNPASKNEKAVKEFRNLEDQLKRKFATRVKINEKDGKGKLEFNFHSMEQFNELVERLLS